MKSTAIAKLLALLLVLCLSLSSCSLAVIIPGLDSIINNEPDEPTDTPTDDPVDNPTDNPDEPNNNNPDVIIGQNGFDYNEVPAFSGENYVVINDNNPYFTEDEITENYFESYGQLDSLGRVTTAFACLGPETLPTGSRPSISYKPTGWIQRDYPTTIISTTQIYNRSHLIAWSLSGEGNNELNLMTGTPFFNQKGMQIFEEMVLDYIKETGNHVMYRVTPIFGGNNLLAYGALMEAYSVEDDGEGICFNVFLYNVQPGVILDYTTGQNEPEDDGSDDYVEPITGNYFDPSSLKPVSSSVKDNQYSTRTSDDGWHAEYTALLEASFAAGSPMSVTLNGKSTTKGSLVSPTITGGITSLKFGYGFIYKDTQFSLTINIKQDGVIVDTVTIEKTGLVTGTAYEYEWVLDTPITGNFVIEFYNNALGNVTDSNKERVALYNITWVSAE